MKTHLSRGSTCQAVLFSALLLVAFTMPAAAGSGAPIVTTGTPTLNSPTSVTLFGGVNPNGLATSWRFLLFSLTGSYWVPIGPVSGIGCDGSLAAGTVQVGVSCTVSTLTAGHTYRYDVTATNSAGSATSSYIMFTTPMTGSYAHTDWSVVSVGLNPLSPNPGDGVIFEMYVAALSTTDPFPQALTVQCTIDGVSCGSGTLSYPGPTGVADRVRTETPWTATIGTHTLTWSVATTNDPHPENNIGSTSFTVPSSTVYISTAQSTNFQTSIFSTTIVQTLTIPVQSTSTQTSEQVTTITSSLAEDLISSVRANSLLLIGGLGLLVLVLAALAVRKRKPAKP